jgi:hypothetical protein
VPAGGAAHDPERFAGYTEASLHEEGFFVFSSVRACNF